MALFRRWIKRWLPILYSTLLVVITAKVQAIVIDCSLLVHPQCNNCVTSTAASVTKVVCTSCKGPAYAVAGDTCGCSPGYFLQASSLPTTCGPCGVGYYCPGGISSAAVKHRCAPLLTTASATAAGASACGAPPGYFVSAGKVAPCQAGTYKSGVGISSSTCQKCPSGTTTKHVAATSASDCV